MSHQVGVVSFRCGRIQTADGRWLIEFATKLIGKRMSRQHIGPTVIRYIQNAVAALLNIVLVIAILGFFGVQTTRLAALLAAAGVAIGVAWSGLPPNFAVGIFLVIVQPFKGRVTSSLPAA